MNKETSNTLFILIHLYRFWTSALSSMRGLFIIVKRICSPSASKVLGNIIAKNGWVKDANTYVK